MLRYESNTIHISFYERDWYNSEGNVIKLKIFDRINENLIVFLTLVESDILTMPTVLICDKRSEIKILGE